MFYLVLSITLSVAVSVLLKLARTWRIDLPIVIALNYVTAIAWSLLTLQPEWLPYTLLAKNGFILASLGLLLPGIFLAMAACVRHAGIARSDAAQRISLALPLIAAFTLFGQPASGQALAGIGLALLALYLLSGRAPQHHAPTGTQPSPRTAGLLLFTVWLGYGLIDILFKQMSRTGAAFSSILLACFMLAGIVMALYLLCRRLWTARRHVPTAIRGPHHWQRHALAGLLLGSLNFGNIFFYIRAHQTFRDHPALVFSAMNIGVVALGVLIGAGIFREKLERRHLSGLALTLPAILLLLPR